MTASVVNGKADAEHLQRGPGQAVAPEGEEQRQAGDRGWQHDGQVHEGLGHGLAAERGAGQDEGQRDAEDDDDDQGDRGAREAQHEGVEHGAARQCGTQGSRLQCPKQEGHDRQSQEGQCHRSEHHHGRSRAAAPVASRQPLARGDRADAVAHSSAGSKAALARTAWAAGPVSQITNAAAAGSSLTWTAPYSARHLHGLREGHLADSVRGARVGRVDDGSVTLAQLHLGQGGPHVVLAGDDVGSHGTRERGGVGRRGRQLGDGLLGVARDRHARSGRHEADAGLGEVHGSHHGLAVEGHDDDGRVAARTSRARRS